MSPTEARAVSGPGTGDRPPLDGVVGWPAEFIARYREEGYWGDQTLGALLSDWAQRSGESIAVVQADERISYAELDRRADRMAAGLLALGFVPGDRIIVHLPNRLEFVVALFAMMRSGLVPVLALPAHRRTEIEHFATLSGAAGYLICDRHEGFDYRELAAALAADVPTLRHVLVVGDPGTFAALGDLPARHGQPLPHIDPGTVAILLASGGTTGKPKLIPRTHRDYAYNAAASAQVCRLTADDVYLACLPIAHNFPLACPGLLGALGVGARVVLAPTPSPDVAFGLVERERVTVTALVPPMARMWTDAAAWDTRDRSSLRLLQVGGAKLDVALARRITPELGTALQQVFGMAEGLLNFTRLDDPDELVIGTQGRPLCPADEVRIVDSSGAAVQPGAVGELWARGPYTLRGYYRTPEANALAFSPDGFYRSGDLVRLLPSGHLVVEGRVKDVINRGGENVSAAALEEHLLGHPAVAAAAVVGLPDQTVGELVCAVVTLAPGVERAPKLKEIKAFLAGRGLARFMTPDRLVVRQRLPLTGVGKIDKRELVHLLVTESPMTEGDRSWPPS